MSVLSMSFANHVPAAQLAAEAARQRTMDWLESQARILDFWRDRLLGEGAEPALVETVEAQASWLRDALFELRRG